MLLFIIAECNHEVVLPLDIDGKSSFKNVWNVFKSLKRKIYCYSLSKMSLWNPFHFTKNIERITTVLLFSFFPFHFPECSSYCSSSFWDCPEEALACHDVSATEPQQSHRQAALGLGQPSQAVLSVATICPLQAGREESHHRQAEGHEKRWNRWETSKADLLKPLETNGQVRTKYEPYISIPTLVWKPCSHVPHINMVCPIKKVFSSLHSL